MDGYELDIEPRKVARLLSSSTLGEIDFRTALDFMDEQRKGADMIDLLIQAAGEGVTGVVALVSQSSMHDKWVQLAFLVALFASLKREDDKIVTTPALATATWMAENLSDQIYPNQGEDMSGVSLAFDDPRIESYFNTIKRTYTKLVCPNPSKRCVIPPGTLELDYGRAPGEPRFEMVTHHPAMIAREYIYRLISENTSPFVSGRYILPARMGPYLDLLNLLTLIMDQSIIPDKSTTREYLDTLMQPRYGGYAGVPEHYLGRDR